MWSVSFVEGEQNDPAAGLLGTEAQGVVGEEILALSVYIGGENSIPTPFSRLYGVLRGSGSLPYGLSAPRSPRLRAPGREFA